MLIENLAAREPSSMVEELAIKEAELGLLRSRVSDAEQALARLTGTLAADVTDEEKQLRSAKRRERRAKKAAAAEASATA